MITRCCVAWREKVIKKDEDFKSFVVSKNTKLALNLQRSRMTIKMVEI
jgi:hypothetical protein